LKGQRKRETRNRRSAVSYDYGEGKTSHREEQGDSCPSNEMVNGQGGVRKKKGITRRQKETPPCSLRKGFGKQNSLKKYGGKTGKNEMHKKAEEKRRKRRGAGELLRKDRVMVRPRKRGRDKGKYGRPRRYRTRMARGRKNFLSSLAKAGHGKKCKQQQQLGRLKKKGKQTRGGKRVEERIWGSSTISPWEETQITALSNLGEAGHLDRKFKASGFLTMSRRGEKRKRTGPSRKTPGEKTR